MTGPRFAALNKVPLVVYGEHAAEYGDKIDEAFDPIMKKEYYIFETTLDDLIISGIPAKKIIKDFKIRSSDMNPYLPISHKVLKELSVEVHHLSYYINWDPQENYYYAVDKVGF